MCMTCLRLPYAKSFDKLWSSASTTTRATTSREDIMCGQISWAVSPLAGVRCDAWFVSRNSRRLAAVTLSGQHRCLRPSFRRPIHLHGQTSWSSRTTYGLTRTSQSGSPRTLPTCICSCASSHRPSLPATAVATSCNAFFGLSCTGRPWRTTLGPLCVTAFTIYQIWEGRRYHVHVVRLSTGRSPTTS